MNHLMEKLVSSAGVPQEELDGLFSKMFSGELSEAQIAGILVSLRMRGESGAILESAARQMRTHARPVVLPDTARPLADNCGTGGDGSDSFNISTASALVASALGVAMAKHGNRSVSSRCGSADLLFACGYPTDLSPEATAQLLQEQRFCFLFAPNFHPAMAHVMPVRKSLGIRTLFNLLGPLANPIAPEYQLIGVPGFDYLRPVADALLSLGIRQGLVVHSEDGLDEISPAAPTRAYRIQDGKLHEEHIEPGKLGVSGTLEDLAGGDPQQNKSILESLLANDVPAGLAGAVALNAGAMIWIAQGAESMADGVERAREALRSGAVAKHFQQVLQRAGELAK